MAHEHDAPVNGGGDDEDATDDLQTCIEECLNCHATCTMTVQYVLAELATEAAVDVVGVLLDCADMCHTNANFMLRGSPYNVLTATTCAELCRACAETCRESDDEHMAACAEVCDRCAESCDQMAEMLDIGEGGDDED